MHLPCCSRCPNIIAHSASIRRSPNGRATGALSGDRDPIGSGFCAGAKREQPKEHDMGIKAGGTPRDGWPGVNADGWGALIAPRYIPIH